MLIAQGTIFEVDNTSRWEWIGEAVFTNNAELPHNNDSLEDLIVVTIACATKAKIAADWFTVGNIFTLS